MRHGYYGHALSQCIHGLEGRATLASEALARRPDYNAALARTLRTPKRVPPLPFCDGPRRTTFMQRPTPPCAPDRRGRASAALRPSRLNRGPADWVTAGRGAA